jgi:telomere length regulation protein
LAFSDWDGDGDGREWARKMRELIKHVDSDSIIAKDLILDNENTVQENEENSQERQFQKSSEEETTVQKIRSITIQDGDDSDDSLEGYESETSSSSTSPSGVIAGRMGAGDKPKSSKLSDFRPTVEEINADPTLLMPTKDRIRKPVYLLDLGKLFKVTKEGSEQYESIRMGLETAVELIRRKAGWGLELGQRTILLVWHLQLTCQQRRMQWT